MCQCQRRPMRASLCGALHSSALLLFFFRLGVHESRSFMRSGGSTIVKVCDCGTCLPLIGARVLQLQ